MPMPGCELPGELLTEQEADRAKSISSSIIKNVEKVIIGKREAIELALITLICLSRIPRVLARRYSHAVLPYHLAVLSSVSSSPPTCCPAI